MSEPCGCCGDPEAKSFDGTPYCREHYIHCLHDPWRGDDGLQDFDEDSDGLDGEEYVRVVEKLGAQWDAKEDRQVLTR